MNHPPLQTLSAVLTGCDRVFAQLDGHTILVDVFPNGVVSIYLDHERCNSPADQKWYDNAGQMETDLASVLTSYVPGSALWQPAEADLDAVLAEWGRHGADGYTIGPGYVQFDDCSLCREFGWPSCRGHDYDPDALDALEDELDND